MLRQAAGRKNSGIKKGYNFILYPFFYAQGMLIFNKNNRGLIIINGCF